MEEHFLNRGAKRAKVERVVSEESDRSDENENDECAVTLSAIVDPQEKEEIFKRTIELREREVRLREREAKIKEREVSIRDREQNSFFEKYRVLKEMGIELDDRTKIDILDNVSIMNKQRRESYK